MVAVTTNILTAAGKPAWTLHASWPLLIAVPAGHLVFIPLAGSVGAAAITTTFAIVWAIVTASLVHKLWRIAPPAGTLRRSAVACVPAYMIASLLPASGLLLVLKLAAVGLFVVAALLLLGEFSEGEIGAVRTTLRHRLRLAVETTGSASS
jgi:O-antigen/teichoic acid export membrane protein